MDTFRLKIFAVPVKSPALLFGVMLILLSPVAYGQSRSLSDRFPANRWSVEAQVGAGTPFSNGKYVSDLGDTSTIYNLSFPSLSVGLRYMFSRTVGVRSSYVHHHFARSSEKLRIHTYAIEGVYSFSGLFPEGRISRPREWNVLAHAGGAYSFGVYYNSSGGRDRIITGLLGSTLQYRLFPSLAVTFDLTAQFNSFQDKSLAPNVDAASAASTSLIGRLFKPTVFLYPSVGAQFYFGKSHQHVDWR